MTNKTMPPLQKNAVLLPQVESVDIATFVPLKVDARVEVCGVTWLRVYGGFGGRFDREDWIAVLPAVAISVCDYYWNGSDFGPSYGSFENACRERLTQAVSFARSKKSKLESEIDKLIEAITLLESLDLTEAV